jgi:predicted HicB family RNase H-like nuclease
MDKYTYRVTWSEEDNEYVGLCAEFPSLSWLAKTQEDALAGIKDTVNQVVHDMKTSGETVPEPLATRKYSGHFTVRVPPEVHRKLQMEAAEENISFNRLISAKLAG